MNYLHITFHKSIISIEQMNYMCILYSRHVVYILLKTALTNDVLSLITHIFITLHQQVRGSLPPHKSARPPHSCY
jgi:hypothetical protein